MIFQLKERTCSEETSPQTEAKWFESKVIRKATRQIRDTFTYLQTYNHIEIENKRGHRFKLQWTQIEDAHNIICYLPNRKIPQKCLFKKFHKSKTAGIIHLFSAIDYIGIIETLLTPSELSEYLFYREMMIECWRDELTSIPEQALIGQYLKGDYESPPSNSYIKYLYELEHKLEDWDISRIIKTFAENITQKTQPYEYYQIIAEIAKLKRNELKEFKLRFKLSMEKSKNNQLTQPYVIAFTRTDCAFMFLPL